jgi:hypothetical protein
MSDQKLLPKKTGPAHVFSKLTWRHWAAFAGVVLIFAVANLWAWQANRNDILEAAYAVPDGGGYCALNATGVLSTIRHNGSLILSHSKGGSYCCGFTFEIAMKVAEQRGILAKKSVYEVRKFQAEWFGATKSSAEKQCVLAMADLGIGREIDPKDAQPGDFVVFNRTFKIGHSVIFLNWMTDSAGNIVGIHYRSSQGTTNGVADNTEFFSDGTVRGEADRRTMYIARLSRSGWGRWMHPFSG